MNIRKEKLKDLALKINAATAPRTQVAYSALTVGLMATYAAVVTKTPESAGHLIEGSLIGLGLPRALNRITNPLNYPEFR